MAEQKSHKPTKKRERDARKDGKVLKSNALSQALALTAALLVLIFGAKFLWLENKILLHYTWTQGFEDPIGCLKLSAEVLAVSVAVVLLPAGIVGILVETAQIGFFVESSILLPRLSRLNVATGFKRLASGLKQLWVMLLKIASLGFSVSWLSVWFTERVTTFSLGSLAKGNELLHSSLMLVLSAGCTLMLFFGVLDFLVKRKEYLKELSMSHDEIRRETKDEEGDPLVKTMRRLQHEELLQRDLVARVRRSKVIVVERDARC